MVKAFGQLTPSCQGHGDDDFAVIVAPELG